MNSYKSHFRKIFLSFLYFSIIFFCSCERKKDPLSSVSFGEVSVKDFLKNYSESGLIEIVEGDSENEIQLVFYYLNGNNDLKSSLWINPGRYEFKKVKSIYIYFGSDSVLFFEKLYRPGEGEISNKKLNSVLELFKDWYGEPNFTFRGSQYFSEIYKVIEAQAKQKEITKKGTLAGTIDGRSRVSNYLVWEQEGFNLMISYSQSVEDSLFSSNTIRYEMKEYQDLLQKKKDDVRKKAVLNDYINLDLNLNPFSEADFPYTDRLNLYISSLGHKLPEEERDITKFRFNVIIKNEYGDILLTLNDLNIDFEYPLESPSEGYFTSKTGGYSFSVDFNRNNSQGNSYEKLRRLREQKVASGNFADIKIEHEITAIIFEDGEVLKN